MLYQELNYQALENRGIPLSNHYQDKKSNSPILLNGEVYKFFRQGAKKKEKLLLKLEELHLKNLIEPKSFITFQGVVEGFTYPYYRLPLLASLIFSDIDYDKRISYINDLLLLDSELVKNGLTYFDYHSANVLIGDYPILLDIDSILNATEQNRKRIKEHLFELIMSLYLNYDISLDDGNRNLYELFQTHFPNYNFLNDLEIDLNKIFEELLRKNASDALELKHEVINHK